MHAKCLHASDYFSPHDAAFRGTWKIPNACSTVTDQPLLILEKGGIRYILLNQTCCRPITENACTTTAEVN